MMDESIVDELNSEVTDRIEKLTDAKLLERYKSLGKKEKCQFLRAFYRLPERGSREIVTQIFGIIPTRLWDDIIAVQEPRKLFRNSLDDETKSSIKNFISSNNASGKRQSMRLVAEAFPDSQISQATYYKLLNECKISDENTGRDNSR